MGVSGALLAALVLTGDGGRRARCWRWLLAPIAVVSLIGAIEQVGSYAPRAGSRTAALRHPRLNIARIRAGRAARLRRRSTSRSCATPLPHVDFPPIAPLTAAARSRSPAADRQPRRHQPQASPDLLDISGAQDHRHRRAGRRRARTRPRAQRIDSKRRAHRGRRPPSARRSSVGRVLTPARRRRARRRARGDRSAAVATPVLSAARQWRRRS